MVVTLSFRFPSFSLSVPLGRVQIYFVGLAGS